MQKIDDAYSSVVNLDYFPVAVSELPIIDGTRATPEQFLEHIRKGINDFIDPFYSEFTPYHWYGVDDTQLWNSNNPLGAVVAVDIAGLEDASVIVSHSSSDKWIFTTIYDPRFGEWIIRTMLTPSERPEFRMCKSDYSSYSHASPADADPLRRRSGVC